MDSAKPLWNQLHTLHGHRRDLPFQDTIPIDAAIPSYCVSQHGGLLSTAERFADQPAMPLDWVAAGLELNQHESWKRLRAGCLSMMKRFFAKRGNAAAWIHFEGCRDPLTVQAPELRMAPYDPEWNLPSLKSQAGHYEFRSSLKQGPHVLFPRKSLVVVDAQGNPRTGLVRMSRSREVANEHSLLAGKFDTWCAADPEEHRDQIDKGWIPAGFPLRISPQLHTGMLIDWVVLNGQGMADMFTLELHPRSAEIVSIRSARVPIEVVFSSQRRYHGCIASTLGENPEDLPRSFVLDDTIKQRLRQLIDNPHQVSFRVIHCLEVLCHFTRTGSLNRTGTELHVGENKGTRNLIRNLETYFQIDLVDYKTDIRGNKKARGPSQAAKEIVAWYQCYVLGQGRQ